MKYLKRFATAQEAATVLATWPFNTVSSIQGIQGASINLGVPPPPTHPYVEIGGVKWATMNIGAESEGDPGLYFQWGSTHGYPEGQQEVYFEWNSCAYYASYENFSKYNKTDNKTVLDLEDDAVHAAWGGNWRMPTKDEFQTLLNATNQSIVKNGMYGIQLTDKTDDTKKIFIPFGGQMFGWTVNYKAEESTYIGKYGTVWTSTLNYNNSKSLTACYYSCGFSSKSYSMVSNIDFGERRYGYNCRGILDE